MPEEEKENTPPTYRDKILGMLDKVDHGEKVFEDTPVDAVAEIIKNDGVQDGIRNIFGTKVINESVEEEFETVKKNEERQDSPKVASPSSFINVSEKKDVPDIFPTWEKARSYLGRLGSRIDDGPTYVTRRVIVGDEADEITIRLVKNEERDGVPYMQISFGEEGDSTPAEIAVPYIESVGIRVVPETIQETPSGNAVYFEFDA